MQQYRAIVGRLPRPTEPQIASYVDFVCGVQDWSKALPMAPPGVQLVFFLDPSGPESRSGLAAEQYRARFGHLACDLECYFETGDGIVRVPHEIRDCGSVELTGVVHRSAAAFILSGAEARLLLGEKESAWPIESGGRETFQAICALIVRARELRRAFRAEQVPASETRRWSAYQAQEAALEKSLDALLEPERRRLRSRIAGAIGRMLALCYDPLPPRGPLPLPAPVGLLERFRRRFRRTPT